MKEWIETITYGIGEDQTHEKLVFEYMDEITDVPRSAGIYVFKAGHEFLYIGETSNLRKRIQRHVSGSDTEGPSKNFINEWTHLHYVSIPYDKDLRTLTESLLIKRYDSKYNSNDMKRLLKSYGNEETVYDLLYYTRVAKLHTKYIAEEFGVTVPQVLGIDTGSTGGGISLPKDYSPRKKLDMTKKRNAFTQLSKKKFYEIRKYLAETDLTVAQLARMFDVNRMTIQGVKDLNRKRFKRWNAELFAEKTTV
jgi:hypothetical protein